MKMLMVILVLAGTAGTLRAQDAQTAFTMHPYIVRGDLAASRFWTRSTIALVALDGAAKVADSYVTRRNMDGGGEEYNPLARPFVHTPLVQVAATAALFGAEIAAAYVLHRRHHDKMGRAVLVVGATVNGLGAASSFKHRVANW
jgi:hypothetical protein